MATKTNKKNIFKADNGNLFVQFMYKGKNYYKSIGSANMTLAEKTLIKMKHDLYQQHELKILPEQLLHDAFDYYLKQNEGRTRYNTLVGMVNWLKPRTKKMMVSDITTPWLIELMDQKRAEGAQEGTIRNYIQIFSVTTRYAAERGYNTTEFYKPRTTAPKKKLRFITKEEEKTVLDLLDPTNPNNKASHYKRPGNKASFTLQDDWDLFAMLLDTGCRVSEVMNMKWEQVDLDKETIRVIRTKTDSETILHMTDRVKNILTRRLQTATTEWIFTNESQTGPRRSTVGIRTALDMAGLEDVTNHTLRHTTASRLIQNKMSLYEVSNILGHASVQTTQIYAHLAQGDVAEKAKNILNNL